MVPGLPAEIVPRYSFLLSPSDQSRAGVLDADQPGLGDFLAKTHSIPAHHAGLIEPGLAAGYRAPLHLAPLVGSVTTPSKLSWDPKRVRLPGHPYYRHLDRYTRTTRRAQAPNITNKLTRRERQRLGPRGRGRHSWAWEIEPPGSRSGEAGRG